VRVRPGVDALLLFDVDAERVAAEIAEEVVQVGCDARARVAHHRQRGERPPVPAQGVDAGGTIRS